MENTEKKGVLLSFAAIDQYVSSNIITPDEKELKNSELVEFGDNNAYPQYIYDLFCNVPSLRSVINSLADYIGGENIAITAEGFETQMNDDGDTIEDIVRQIALDLGTYGGFALNIIRDKAGRISQIYNTDLKFLRSDKKNKTFFYSEEWEKGRRCKYLTYPRFSNAEPAPSSIFFYKNEKHRTYPVPVWGAATKSAEVEKLISEYHLNNICNGFAGSYIINLNNGKPTDEQKEEIEENMKDKFAGVENAGRMVIAFNDSKENEATIAAIPQNDFEQKYEALRKSAKQEIFTAFRCSPILCGIPTEGSSFNKEDYDQCYKLFAKTVVLPFQKTIKRAFETIFDTKEVIVIEPFRIDFDEDNNNKDEENVM